MRRPENGRLNQMSENNHCQNHPDRAVTARCVRFNRRFCELDFESSDSPAECLSPVAYCEYRPQCLVWAKSRAREKRERLAAQPAVRTQDL
jgi:hypothetical protein